MFVIVNVLITFAYLYLINLSANDGHPLIEMILPAVIIITCLPAIVMGIVTIPALLSGNGDVREKVMQVVYASQETWMAFSPVQSIVSLLRSGLVIIALSGVGWFYSGGAVIIALVFGLLYEGIIRAYLKELH